MHRFAKRSPPLLTFLAQSRQGYLTYILILYMIKICIPYFNKLLPGQILEIPIIQRCPGVLKSLIFRQREQRIVQSQNNIFSF